MPEEVFLPPFVQCKELFHPHYLNEGMKSLPLSPEEVSRGGNLLAFARAEAQEKTKENHPVVAGEKTLASCQ